MNVTTKNFSFAKNNKSFTGKKQFEIIDREYYDFEMMIYYVIYGMRVTDGNGDVIAYYPDISTSSGRVCEHLMTVIGTEPKRLQN